MRRNVRSFALAALLLAPAGLFAQAVYFKNGTREERWALNDPFAPADTRTDAGKAFWKSNELSMAQGGVTRTRKDTEIVRIDWPEPALLLKAKESVERGDAAAALREIEPLLFKLDKLRKTPGSPWLKSAEVKLDALSQLSNAAVLTAFIGVLEENDDGSVPGLAAKLKLARLSVKAREGDNTGVLTEADKLLGELEEPDTRARLYTFKSDALFALRRYEEALNAYLQIPVFYGSEKAFVPGAYLGAAKALRAMDSPTTHEQRLDLAAVGYLKDIIRDYPVSKEAQEAKKLLPREERVAEEKKLLVETPAKTDGAKDAAAEETRPTETKEEAKPAEAKEETKPAEPPVQTGE